jgi:hypothetical protein
MPRVNGLFKWLVGLATLIGVSLAAWAGNTIIDHGQAIEKNAVKIETFERWLERVENKLDRALGRALD